MKINLGSKGDNMKKRWLCLFVENEIGVLARISGLFAGKSYNLDSLTVGTTEDLSVSRMTISLTSDDRTFEQIKKQLNRSVEVIKVVDYTEISIHRKELLFIRITGCTEQEKSEVFRIAHIFPATIIDYDFSSILVECTQTEEKNNDFIALLQKQFPNRLAVTRGGSVAVEAMGSLALP